MLSQGKDVKGGRGEKDGHLLECESYYLQYSEHGFDLLVSNYTENLSY